MPFTITRVGKKPWRYIPLASWNSDAPWITVLSRSKNAAAAGSARITGSGETAPESGVSSSGPAAASGFSGEISMADASVPGSASTWSAGPSGPVTRPTIDVPDFEG